MFKKLGQTNIHSSDDSIARATSKSNSTHHIVNLYLYSNSCIKPFSISNSKLLSLI